MTASASDYITIDVGEGEWRFTHPSVSFNVVGPDVWEWGSITAYWLDGHKRRHVACMQGLYYVAIDGVPHVDHAIIPAIRELLVHLLGRADV